MVLWRPTLFMEFLLAVPLIPKERNEPIAGSRSAKSLHQPVLRTRGAQYAFHQLESRDRESPEDVVFVLLEEWRGIYLPPHSHYSEVRGEFSFLFLAISFKSADHVIRKGLK